MLIINAEPLPGTTIEDTCREAIQLAAKLDCRVSVAFNGVPILADREDDVPSLIAQFEKDYVTIRQCGILGFSMLPDKQE